MNRFFYAIKLTVKILMAVTLTIATPFVSAQTTDSDDFIKKLSYPELDVSPRASERLLMEAQRENKSRFSTHLPIQVSALSTLLAGVMIAGNPSSSQKKDGDFPDSVVEQNAYASQFAILVGASWLVTTTLMSIYYTPYQTGFEKIKKESSKTTRDQLTRERLAEEALEAPALISPVLVNLSFITNFSASAYAVVNSDLQGTLISGIAAALAFTPYVFDYRWEYVFDQHQLYKKRIYGPVSTIQIEYDKSGNPNVIPALAMSIDF